MLAFACRYISLVRVGFAFIDEASGCRRRQRSRPIQLGAVDSSEMDKSLVPLAACQVETDNAEHSD